MNFKAFCASMIALTLNQQANATTGIRRVSYTNLPSLEAQPILTPASDADCQGPDPFANVDWRNTGLTGGCPTGRMPYLTFNVGQKVPVFDSAAGRGIDVAILTLDEISAMRSLNPGATFRFELKVSGNWNRFHNNFMPISLFPSSGCVSQSRFKDLKALYRGQGLDWNSKWFNQRTKISGGSPDYKAFQSEVNGPHGFSYVQFYDFDMDECDAPLTLQFSSQNFGSIRFDMLEVNIYVCSAASGCAEVANFF